MGRIALGGMIVLWLLMGCSPSRVCEPGSTQRCVCPTAEGAQVCASDGTAWGACACGGVDGGLGDAAPPIDAFTPGIDTGTIDTGSADAGGADAGTDDGGADASSACSSPTTSTVTDVANGTIGAGTLVRLSGVVAMSHPFLVSQASASGSCLWGVFVSAPGLAQTAPYSGLLVESYGFDATIPPGGGRAFCPVRGVDPTGSLIPDDTTPGRVIDVVGTVQSALSGGCASMAGATTVPQISLRACGLAATGNATPPTPATLSAADVTAISMQGNTDAHRRWGSVLVRLTNVTPTGTTPTSCAGGMHWTADTFGSFTLSGSGLVVGDKLYYAGLSSTPPGCHTSPAFCAPTVGWSRIDAIHYLDFCTWSLEVSDPCAGFVPASAACTSSTACMP